MFYLFSLISYAQKKYVTLQPPKKIALKNCYVKIIDFRENKGNEIGYYINPVNKQKTALILKGGLDSCLKNAFHKYVSPINTKDTLEIRVLTYEISQKPYIDNKIEYDINSDVELYYQNQRIVGWPSGYSFAVSKNADPSPYFIKLLGEHFIYMLTEADYRFNDYKTLFTHPWKIETAIKQSDDSNEIIYNPLIKLTASDFKGVPQERDDQVLGSFTELTYKYFFKTVDNITTLKIDISPTFKKLYSWIKPGIGNANTLKLQQIYFDLMGLEACKLADTFQKLVIVPHDVDSVDKILNRVYQSVSADLSNLHTQYRQDIRYMDLYIKQKEWQEKIENELSKINCY